MSNEKASLYDRLGGVYIVAALVDDFIDRVMQDPIINANQHVDHAHQNLTAAGFKYLVTEMVCWAAGGPQNYTGRTMADSHVHLKMNNAEWDAFMHDFDQSLYKFKVPEGESNELIAIMESTKDDMGLID